MGFLLIAFIWGFAEATLFFIVPDVLFTYLVLFDFQLALWACLFALGGALVGGGMMYAWGRRDFQSAASALERLPGISKALIQREKKALQERGMATILLGPLKGIPYKIYAISASSCGISFLRFLLISVPARSFRFIAATLLAELISHRLLVGLSLSTQIGILSLFWLLFYAGYFVKMGNFSR